MPAFSFSRTQEILTCLYELYYNADFKYDIVVDSMLTCDICDLYDFILTGEDLDLWKEIRRWKNIKFIKDKEDSLYYVKNHDPKIVISSSGSVSYTHLDIKYKRCTQDSNLQVIKMTNRVQADFLTTRTCSKKISVFPDCQTAQQSFDN